MAKNIKSKKIRHENDGDKKRKKLGLIVGLGTGAVLAGTIAGVAVAAQKHDNSQESNFHIFETKTDVLLKLDSHKSLAQLKRAANNVNTHFKPGFDKYSNDQFNKDFAVTLPVPYDVTTVFWFDYRDALSEDAVVCDFQYHDPGDTKIKNGSIRIYPAKKGPTHKEKVLRNFYEVKHKEYESRPEAEHAVDGIVEKRSLYAVKGDSSNQLFFTKNEALDKLANMLIATRVFDASTVPAALDGVIDLTHADSIPEHQTHTGFLYNGRLYASKDMAASAWLADNPNRVEAQKGHALVTIDVHGKSYIFDLPKFDFGDDPEEVDLLSKLSWHKVETGVPTGITSSPATKSIAQLYIDGQKITLTKDSGLPLTTNDITLTTVEEGVPSTHHYHHVSTFEIDGQLIKAARDDNSPTPLQESDFTFKTLIEGAPKTSGAQSSAQFIMDDRTFKAYRVDGQPIKQSDIHPYVERYGEVRYYEDMQEATFTIDDQLVTLRKKYMGADIKSTDFLLSAGRGNSLPTEADPTTASFTIGGQTINATREDGGTISAGDIAAHSLYNGSAPKTYTGSVVELTLADGQKIKAGTNSTDAINFGSFDAITVKEPEFKNGLPVGKQEVAITPEDPTQIDVSQRTVFLDLTGRTTKYTESEIIKALTPITTNKTFAVSEEFEISGMHGISFDKTRVVNAPGPNAASVPTAQNFRVTHAGHASTPGHGVQIHIRPNHSYITVDKDTIEFKDPTYIPPLFPSYVANRLYVRNFQNTGTVHVPHGQTEKVHLSVAPGILIKELGTSQQPSDSLEVTFKEATQPIRDVNLISHFVAKDGVAHSHGAHQVIQIIPKTGIDISKSHVTFTTAKANKDNVVMEKFIEHSTKIVSFGHQQVVKIEPAAGVVADKHSITFRADRVSVSISDIISKSAFSSHDGTPETAGSIETAKDKYELWLNGAPIIDKHTSKHIVVEEPWINFGKKQIGTAPQPPESVIPEDVEIIITKSAALPIANVKEHGYINVSETKNLTQAAVTQIQAAGATGVADDASLHDTRTSNVYFTVLNKLSLGFATKPDAIAYVKAQLADRVYATPSPTEYWEKDDHSVIYHSRDDAYHKLIIPGKREEEIEVENE